jgi:hypothetical protein
VTNTEELRGQILAVISTITDGDLPAELDQIAFLRGAVAALEAIDQTTTPGATMQHNSNSITSLRRAG